MIGETVKKWCNENELFISDHQAEQFENYAALLQEWNQKMNLTAIVEPQEIAVKHFIDSLSVLKYISINDSAKIIDIGTGAGFPGIPLLIMHPSIRLTLLDSLNKRLLFLKEVCSTLDLTAELVHGRAEEYSRRPEYREQYDLAISRAVANLPSLCEYCIPYVKQGGTFCSMKGSGGETELKSAENAIRILGGKVESVNPFVLPDQSERTIIVIQKLKSTPEKYPRRGTKINKNPL